MPRAIDFVCTVTPDGHLPDARRRFVASQLRLYAGREVRVQISRPKRSSQANRYYWGAIIEPIRDAMNDAGCLVYDTADGVGMPVTSEMVHELMKARHLPVRVVEMEGDPVTLAPSTADLDATAFSEYSEAIRGDELVLSLGVYLEDAPGGLRSHKIAEVA
jgi:hypothetical protein